MENFDKFDRNYEVTIHTDTINSLIVTLPFTIEFDITRNSLTSANVCQIRLYNLSAKNRNSIYFNAYNPTVYKAIELKAGYGNNLSTIFQGNITQSWSVREGTNFISQIECFDSGFGYVNGNINLSFTKGTPLSVVISTIIGQIPNVKIGAIGKFTDILTKDNTYKGNAAEILYELTGGAFYIDQGKAYALKTDEYVPQIEFPLLINADTGLLNTPVLEQNVARFEMLFEPSLNVGSLVTVTSVTNPSLNGLRKVTAVKHRGTISKAVSGNCITIGEFYNSKQLTPATGF